jgi:hypothetical protein
MELKKILARRLNLFAAWGYAPLWPTNAPSRELSAESNQDEIDQGDQGCPDAGGDQGVVGADVAMRIGR